MNVLILGLGDSGWEDSESESVLRQREYARRAGGYIDLIIDSPRVGTFHHGALTVHLTGSPRAQYLFAARKIALEIARQRMPDLITSQDPFGTALAGWAIRNQLRRPLLIQNHSSFLFNRYWLDERPVFFRGLQALARFVLPKADGWRVVNTAEKRIYADRLQIPEDRIRVLPVPCDLAPFLADEAAQRSEATRAKLNIPTAAPFFLWAGRLVRVKRLPVLLDAFARLRLEFPTARLILAGEKRIAQENLARAAVHAGVDGGCRWLGAMPRAELADLFAAADIFLMSSAYEGFGRVLVEAGAAGLPAVSTATAGASEIIRDNETGCLVKIGDSFQMAEGASRLWKDKGMRERMGRTARAHVLSHFQPEAAFEGIVAQWQDLAREGIHL